MSRNYEQTQDDLLNMYVRQYYQIRNHIESLNDMLDEININIINITNNHLIRNRVNRNHNSFNRRQHNHVRYDYNNPINPSIYNLQTNNSISNNSSNNNSNNNINNNSNNNTRRNRNRNNSNNTDFYRRILDLFSENVPIIPTQQQIDNATRLVRYSDILEPLSEACPITLERFRLDDNVRQIETCGHIFLPQAFNQWFNSNVRCPVCRYDIRTYTTTDRNNVTNNTTTPIVSNAVSEEDNLNASTQSSHYNSNLLSSLSSRIFQELLNPTSNSNSNNDTFMYDASNNMFYFETILRPNSSYGNI